MRRVACIALPEIRIEAASDGAGVGTSPLAIVITRPGGSVESEKDLIGGTRLDAVSREGQRVGVRSGQTVAVARAKCSRLLVRVIAEEAIRSALVRVAEMAMAFGPVVAFDEAQDVVWVEIGGCAHLYGGEHDLVRTLEARVRALGHANRIAIADGPRTAAAFARWSRRPTVVPEGQSAAALRSLPISAIALDDETAVWLADLGLRTCGDMQKLPSRALAMRLGADGQDVLQWLQGDDRAPLDAWLPEAIPEERIELEWDASSLETLAFIAKRLCDRIAARLQGRGMTTTRLELVLELDRALCSGATDAYRRVVDVALSSSVVHAAEWVAVLRARLERETIEAPVRAVTLRALALAPVAAQTLDLFSPEPKAVRALPRLVAELVAELDPQNVGTLELVDTWVPDERTRLVPFRSARAPAVVHRQRGSAASRRTGDWMRAPSPLVTAALEPSRCISPIPVARTALTDVRLLARIEAVEWWRRGFSRRDMAAAWLAAASPADSKSVHALAWVELPSHGERIDFAISTNDQHAILHGWID